MKAMLQDFEDGKIPLTFSEITPERISFAIEVDNIQESGTIVRENGKWVDASEPLGQDCSSLDTK